MISIHDVFPHVFSTFGSCTVSVKVCISVPTILHMVVHYLLCCEGKLYLYFILHVGKICVHYIYIYNICTYVFIRCYVVACFSRFATCGTHKRVLCTSRTKSPKMTEKFFLLFIASAMAAQVMLWLTLVFIAAAAPADVSRSSSKGCRCAGRERFFSAAQKQQQQQRHRLALFLKRFFSLFVAGGAFLLLLLSP